jgi:hypothetical protein
MFDTSGFEVPGSIIRKEKIEMYGFRVSRETMQRFGTALREGRPFKPIGEQWTTTEMVHLIGVLVAGIFSHGPIRLRTEIQDSDELAEALRVKEELLNSDVAMTMIIASNLAFQVFDNALEERFVDGSIVTIAAQGELPKAKVQFWVDKPKGNP